MSSHPKPPSIPAAEQVNGRERRTHERIVVDLEVDYCAADTFLFAYITDISAVGIFIRTNNPEPPGTHINLRFTAPSGRILRYQGEVVWINPPQPGESRNPGMGVQFINLTDEQRGELLHLVKTFAYLSDPADAKHAQD